MLMAVMSDSHDHLENVGKALAVVRERGAEMILHCGDLVAPFTLRALAQAGPPVHAAFGNNDGDRYLLQKTAARFPHVFLHGEFGVVDAGGLPVGFAHLKETAAGLAALGLAKMVFFGHTHVHESLEVAGIPSINPGELLGKDGQPGFLLVDTATGAW
ncbi:MAG: YfcE family phosphodiesterase, partial [Pseudomonadota bacterium]